MDHATTTTIENKPTGRKPRVTKKVTNKVKDEDPPAAAPVVDEVPSAEAEVEARVLGATRDGQIVYDAGCTFATHATRVVFGGPACGESRKPHFAEIAGHPHADRIYAKVWADHPGSAWVFDIQGQAAEDVGTRIRRERALIDLQRQNPELNITFIGPDGVLETATRRGLVLQ